MAAIELTSKQRDLIERLGVCHQQQGLPPAESRIMSLLLVADATELTFEQITDTLQISKSATSTALNTLQAVEKVIYSTRPGDRKRYFSSNLLSWKQNCLSGVNKMFAVQQILNEVLELRTPETPEFNTALGELIEFMDYMRTEMPLLFQRWLEQKQNK